MGQVVFLKGATVASADRTAAPMRQPGYASDIIGGAGRPASQLVSLGDAVRNLLDCLERRMNENAITKS